jgi:glucosamine 6-phosphate synthetase-like amidotransferase/phosphosugar isomerase protein
MCEQCLKPGKIEEISNQIKETNLDILGISETRWARNGDYNTVEAKKEKITV